MICQNQRWPGYQCGKVNHPWLLWFGVSRCRAVLVNIARLKEVTEERNSQREMKERRAQRAVLAERDPPPPTTSGGGGAERWAKWCCRSCCAIVFDKAINQSLQINNSRKELWVYFFFLLHISAPHQCEWVRGLYTALLSLSWMTCAILTLSVFKILKTQYRTLCRSYSQSLFLFSFYIRQDCRKFAKNQHKCAWL